MGEGIGEHYVENPLSVNLALAHQRVLQMSLRILPSHFSNFRLARKGLPTQSPERGFLGNLFYVL